MAQLSINKWWGTITEWVKYNWTTAKKISLKANKSLLVAQSGGLLSNFQLSSPKPNVYKIKCIANCSTTENVICFYIANSSNVGATKTITLKQKGTTQAKVFTQIVYKLSGTNKYDLYLFSDGVVTKTADSLENIRIALQSGNNFTAGEEFTFEIEDISFTR